MSQIGALFTHLMEQVKGINSLYASLDRYPDGCTLVKQGQKGD
jgi:hypothetical protein